MEVKSFLILENFLGSLMSYRIPFDGSFYYFPSSTPFDLTTQASSIRFWRRFECVMLYKKNDDFSKQNSTIVSNSGDLTYLGLNDNVQGDQINVGGFEMNNVISGNM